MSHVHLLPLTNADNRATSGCVPPDQAALLPFHATPSNSGSSGTTSSLPWFRYLGARMGWAAPVRNSSTGGHHVRAAVGSLPVSAGAAW